MNTRLADLNIKLDELCEACHRGSNKNTCDSLHTRPTSQRILGASKMKYDNISDKIFWLQNRIDDLRDDYDRAVEGAEHHYVDWGRDRLLSRVDVAVGRAQYAMDALEQALRLLEGAIDAAERELPNIVERVNKVSEGT